MASSSNPTGGRAASGAELIAETQRSLETKDPSGGGQPDGSNHMALGVEGRSRQIWPRWGEVLAPTGICLARAAGRSTR